MNQNLILLNSDSDSVFSSTCFTYGRFRVFRFFLSVSPRLSVLFVFRIMRLAILRCSGSMLREPVFGRLMMSWLQLALSFRLRLIVGDTGGMP